MRSKNKYLFAIFFLLVVVALAYGGVELFNYLSHKYVENGFRNLIESEPGIKIEERNSPVSFDTTVRYSFYFIFSLVSLTVLWYAYEFVDYIIFKFERRKALKKITKLN